MKTIFNQFNKVSKILKAFGDRISQKAVNNHILKKQVAEQGATICFLMERNEELQHIISNISHHNQSDALVDSGGQKMLEQAFRDSEERYRLIFENSGEAILFNKPEGAILTANPEACRIFNRTEEEMIKVGRTGMIDMNDPRVALAIEERTKTGKFKGELNFLRKDQTSFPCEVTSNLFKDAQGNFRTSMIIHDISERKRVEEALLESEEKFRELADFLPQVIFEADVNGNFIFVNKQAFKIFGYPEDFQIIGLNSLGFHLPEERERATENIHRIISGERVVNNEYSMVRKDGSTFPALVYSSPILKDNKPKGLRGIIIDISDRKLAEERLYESEQHYRLLVETANEGILVGQGTKLMFVNPMIMELTGYSEQELLSRPFLDFVHHEDRELLLINQQKRIKGEAIDLRYHLRVLRKDGIVKWVEMGGVKIDWKGKPAAMNFVSDITARKQAEDEIKRQHEKLQKINIEKDKFFSIISHDLRSPFSGFLGLTQIMAEELSSLTMAEIQEIAVSMRNSAINLFRLLENLLQWSRMQQGLIPYEPTVIRLLPVVEESISMVLEPAKTKEIEIVNNITYDLMVFADNNLLQTVLRNLFSNAVKFTPRGGKVILSSRTTDERNIEISVIDNGIGMSSLLVDELFTLDAQTGRKGTEGEASTGLGLLLCKEFIEKHGGKLWVESEEGTGSAFYFTIPLP